MQPTANASPTHPLIVENVTKRFRQGERTTLALDNISLTVSQGEFVAIMGASGSGKSTLLHLMAGLAVADAGRVLVNGTDLAKLSDKQLTLFRRRSIGLVFQSFNLLPTLSAIENVMLPLLLERNTKADAAKADALLTTLGLAPRRDHRPDALSGGEMQRVAIGRALVTDPAVILADEPTGNLDSVNSKSVCELLRDLSRHQGRTIVMVTHEPTVAAYASRVAVLRDGHLVDDFPTSECPDGLSLGHRYQAMVG